MIKKQRPYDEPVPKILKEKQKCKKKPFKPPHLDCSLIEFQKLSDQINFFSPNPNIQCANYFNKQNSCSINKQPLKIFQSYQRVFTQHIQDNQFLDPLRKKRRNRSKSDLRRNKTILHSSLQQEVKKRSAQKRRTYNPSICQDQQSQARKKSQIKLKKKQLKTHQDKLKKSNSKQKTFKKKKSKQRRINTVGNQKPIFIKKSIKGKMHRLTQANTDWHDDLFNLNGLKQQFSNSRLFNSSQKSSGQKKIDLLFRKNSSISMSCSQVISQIRQIQDNNDSQTIQKQSQEQAASVIQQYWRKRRNQKLIVHYSQVLNQNFLTINLQKQIIFPSSKKKAGLDSSLFNLQSSAVVNYNSKIPSNQMSPFQIQQIGDKNAARWEQVNEQLKQCIAYSKKSSKQDNEKIMKKLIQQSQYNKRWVQDHQFSKRNSRQQIYYQQQQEQQLKFKVIRPQRNNYKDIQSYLDQNFELPSSQSARIQDLLKLRPKLEPNLQRNQKISQDIYFHLIQQIAQDIFRSVYSPYFMEKLQYQSAYLPFRTGSQGIEQFLLTLSQFILSQPVIKKKVSNRLSKDLNPQCRQYLRILQQGEPETLQQQQQYVLPSQLFIQFERMLFDTEYFQFQDEEITEMQQRRIHETRNLKYCFYRSIFDAFNQSLDQQRPYGISGKPFPWFTPAYKRQKQINQITLALNLLQARTKVAESASISCGTLLTQDQIMDFGSQKIKQLQERKQSRLLFGFQDQMQQQWKLSSEQMTIICLEAEREICQYLFYQIVSQLKSLC